MKLVKLKTLFNITYGNKMDYNKMSLLSVAEKNAVAFVSRTRENNGVVAFVEKIATVTPYPAGYITVALGGSVLSSFIQAGEFYTGQNVAVLEPLSTMPFSFKVYYCMAIQSNAFRYSTCGREANKTLKTLLVPSLDDVPEYVKYDEPDYSFLVDSINQKKTLLHFKRWDSFKFTQLFTIKKGKRVTKLDMIPGDTPFISANVKNNAVREFAGLTPIFKPNTITVNYNGNGVAEAFYQEIPYWASDDVNVLYPKFQINKYIAMFIITVIRQDKYRYNYGRKWHKERMEESYIKLPAKEDGSPDFDFMELYIKSVPYSANI